MAATKPSKTSVPYLTTTQSSAVIKSLQAALYALNDLHLTLKHVHWNVTGPNFIAVHEMLDPQIEDIRNMADAVAERIAMLGGVPDGRSGSLVGDRTWSEYSLDKGSANAHLSQLDHYFNEIIKVVRHAEETAGENDDSVTEGILTGQLEELEKYHWFTRAHLEG